MHGAPEHLNTADDSWARVEDSWTADWNPRLVAFDLDDTLAPSKSPVEQPMLDALRALLGLVEVCVISGGQISQFRLQLVDRLDDADGALLRRLHLMPTCGTQYWRYDGSGWRQEYAENLTESEIDAALASLTARAKELDLWEQKTWGPILENRGSQVTFSALGQAAPVDAKRAWDPTGEKKGALRAAVARDLPDLEVRSGGSTSIDITRRGIDKAYGIRKLVTLTGMNVDEMLFVGDRLDRDGNDFPVKATGIRCHAVQGWEETADLIRRIVSACSAASAEPAFRH
ncbi:HAD-IIB family hydrolase [Lysobacter korlensis]|uniref:phosphomannomutase n=1 Tax=Lysobacter korlensis TaxID=553636 RepID=A0ABV6RWQ0_9GAMM